MSEINHKHYFKSDFIFTGEENHATEILDEYSENKIDLSDINRVFELYHVKKFLDRNEYIQEWTKEKTNKYREIAKKLNTIVYDFFKNVSGNNVVEIYKSCDPWYWDDFVHYFFQCKTYESIAKENIIEIIKEFNWSPFHILEDKEFVHFFDNEITDLLCDPLYGADFVISYYLEKRDMTQSIYFPRSFTVAKKIKLFNDYLNSETVNPKMLQLIMYAKNNKELPITPNMKLLAEKRNEEFWKNNKTAKMHKYGFCVYFGEYEKEKELKKIDGEYCFAYDTKWIKNNQDFPTLLNNFIYIFEYVDYQMRCSYISGGLYKESITELITVKGKNMYDTGIGFDMVESLSDLQMTGYKNQLEKLNINIENLIKWFFEDYLLNEFQIKNYKCNMPSPTDSLLSKCKTIASAIDGVLSKFDLLCENGEINPNLFKYKTNSPRIKDVPSLVENKYCYIKGDDLWKEANCLFSNQSMLSFTEKTKAKYDTFEELIKNERITLTDCEPYNIKSLNWLINRKTINLKNDIIVLNKERARILKEFYQMEVISLQHFHSKQLKQMIQSGEVLVDNKLFTKPEYQYLDYLLNNSEFSNAKALRNKYIHDSIVDDEKVMTKDYITFLKIMILIIIKINDDICIRDDRNTYADFYKI